MKFNDCFALRFNLYKCGYGFPENVHVFSGMYGESEEFLNSCLADYENINKKSAEEIIGKYRGKTDALSGKTILFAGDSITSDRLSYEKILERVLDKSRVVDGAISSSRTQDLINVLDNFLFAFKPDIVSVMIGTNDSICTDKDCENNSVSLREYERNIGIIADKIKSAGARMVLNSVADADYEKFNRIKPYRSINKEINEKYNAVLKEAALKNGAVFNDYRDKLREFDPELLHEPDALHLSPFAQRLVAGMVLDALLKA